jgi:hypothetical protein
MMLSKSARAALREGFLTGVWPVPAGGEEAEDLFAEAARQGLLGLLARDLASSSSVDQWPVALRERLRGARRSLLVRGVRQLDLAGRVLRSLAREGIRALPLKGAALAETLYDSPADRPMADVDVLALDGFPAAADCVRRLGLREVERVSHAWAFRDPESGFVLELHRSVTSCPGFFPLDADGCWWRRRLTTGPVPWRPAPEDLLLHLALHAAFQHGFGLTLVQFLDFRRLFERDAPDVSRTLAGALAARAERPLLAALRAAKAVVEAPVPTELLDRLDQAGAGNRVLVAIEGDPLRLVAPERPALARMRWAIGRGRRLDLLRRTLWPDRTSLAKGLMRAVRLLRRFGLFAVRSPAVGVGR